MRGRRGADRPHPAGPSTVRAGGTSGRQASALHTDPETAKPGKSLLAADPFQVSRAAGCTRPELCLSRLSLLPCHPPASPHPTHHSAGLRCPGAYSAGCPAQRPSQGTGGHRGRSLPPPLPRLSLWRPPGPDPTRPTSSMESRSQDRALVTAPFTAPGSGPPLPTRGQSALGMRAPSPGRPPAGAAVLTTARPHKAGTVAEAGGDIWGRGGDKGALVSAGTRGREGADGSWAEGKGHSAGRVQVSPRPPKLGPGPSPPALHVSLPRLRPQLGKKWVAPHASFVTCTAGTGHMPSPRS